jgi:hypothetical protein
MFVGRAKTTAFANVNPGHMHMQKLGRSPTNTKHADLCTSSLTLAQNSFVIHSGAVSLERPCTGVLDSCEYWLCAPTSQAVVVTTVTRDLAHHG